MAAAGQGMTAKEKRWFIAGLLLLAVSAYIQLVAANAADKNWLLTAARMLLSGKKLYHDIFEINPPLVIWLYTIPVWLSQHQPVLNEYNLLALFGFAAIALVVFLSTRLIDRHSGFAGNKRRQAFFMLLLAYVFLFFTAPMYFFDREHILLVLTFPYMLRFSPQLAREKLPFALRLAIGLLAAVGFCIKPHAVIPFAMVQLLYILRERRLAILWSLENLLIYAAGVTYVGSIVLFMPEYRTVLTMALATYSAYSRKANGLYSIIIAAVMLGLTFADFRRGHKTPFRRDIVYFSGLCFGYLVYALFNNGWAYTYNPLMSMVRFLSAWVLFEFFWLKADALARGVPPTKFLFGIRSCSVNLIGNLLFYIVCYGAYLFPLDCDNSISCRASAAFFTQAKHYPARNFGVMSLEFYKWSELSRETGESWDTRFNHLWMLPKFILSGPEFTREHRDIIDFVGRAYAEDINHWKPEIFFVDASPEIFSNHPHIDLPAYYGTVPEFKEAWKQYKLAGVIDSCQKAPPGEPQSKAMKTDCRFEVYRRSAP